MFTDENSVIDKEALRTYISSQLSKLHQEAVHLTSDERAKSCWNKINDLNTSLGNMSEQKANLQVLDQIYHLPSYIDRWIHTAVDSPERFEFFVASKAEEVKSGDMQRDYFWALQIRHDQLVALVRVLSRFLESIRSWQEKAPAQVLSDPIFQGLIEYDLESQVYLEAENIHQRRSSFTQN